NARFDSFSDTLNFILDTGSGGISLDSTTAAYFKLKGTPSTRTIRGIAGIRTVSFLNNRKLHLPGLTVDSLSFHINDYSILDAVYGEKIDGIIGYSVLNRYIIKVDYDSSKIEFWSKGSLKYPRGGFLLRPLINTIPVQTARVKDGATISARFLYDMGAGLNMMLSTDFLKDSALLGKKRKLFAKEAEGLGGKIDMHMTVIREVKLGPYRFRNVPVYVFDDTYNITSYPYLGGLIGNDLLRRFNVILNYERRDIYLVPNSHFSEPFDYAYSGLELYYQDGQIVVGDVARNSPAEAIGLREGDVVVAVNKNFNQNLQQYKATIQNPGEKLRIIIQRGGELKEFEFKVKSIL
ncbi:MAG TPA: aspartyl protease family protein, partial [Flavisolibacter sp.]|nr:aspartyl protease family protein [Flavisolibacter sp.]